VQFWTDAMQTKQHDSEKTSLKEKGREYLEGDSWANRWSGHLRKAREAESKLERKDDSSNDTDPESHGKNAEPESVDFEIYGLLRFSHSASVTAKNEARPMDIVGKMMWKLTVKAN